MGTGGELEGIFTVYWLVGWLIGRFLSWLVERFVFGGLVG